MRRGPYPEIIFGEYPPLNIDSLRVKGQNDSRFDVRVKKKY